jgi:peroxiredoxin
MNTKTLIACGGLLAGLLPLFAAGPTTAPAASASEPPAPAAAGSPIDNELEALVNKINTKLRSGSRTADALAPELKEFDALIAAHKGDKSDAAAKAALMRATLYADVLQDMDKAKTMLEQVTKDFADTEASKVAGAYLKQLDAQKESLAVQAALKPGTSFPDFAEKDLAGEPLSIAKYKGKIVLVDFWATWCGPCREEIPNVVAAYEKYHGKGFEIVGISLDQSVDALKSFIAEHKMTWAQYFDGKGWESALPRKYGVNAIPMTYLLDRDGKIIGKDLRGPDLASELERLLK